MHLSKPKTPADQDSRPKGQVQPSGSMSSGTPDRRLSQILKGGQSAPLPIEPSSGTSNRTQDQDGFDWALRRPTLRKSLKAFQNLHKVLSVAVDIGLLLLVLVLVLSLKDVRNILNNVIGEMYQSFTIMDNSTISTTIQVNDAPIPLNFNLPVVQNQVNVTLVQSVTIPGASVTINSGAFLINNAPATVTLPAGTVLPISLSMDVPVQTTLLVDLAVPVQIDLAEANPQPPAVGLHQAFVRLQNVLGPYYCLIRQDVQYTNDPDCNNGIYSPKK